MLSFFPRGVLDEILNLIESVSEDFLPTLQYWVASFCNQLLPEYSSNQFETLRRCYKHIEDVHVTFNRQEKKQFLTKLRHF